MTTPTKVHCFFIADFILGKPCSDKVWQQADLFGDNNNNEREDEQ